jgi:Tol biopolymer transport system component
MQEFGRIVAWAQHLVKNCPMSKASSARNDPKREGPMSMLGARLHQKSYRQRKVRHLFLKPGDRIEGGAQIAMINADGSGFQELTSGDDNNAFPSYSPDGNRLVFRSFGKNGQGLRIMNLETKGVTTLTSDYDNFPQWSPRGDLIMFARQIEGAYDIFTIKPDGTSLKRLTNGKGNDAHMSWSSDGELIAFASSRMGFKDEVAYTDAAQPYGEIFVMRYDGTHVEQLTDNQWEDGTPGWEPFGAQSSCRPVARRRGPAHQSMWLASRRPVLAYPP